jgi:predicted transcriptional regulator
MRRARNHWLCALGLEFWLPLPVLAILFWLGCSLITTQVLSRPYSTQEKLQADTQLEVRVLVNIAAIKAVINPTEATTQVEVTTAESSLRKLEFEFPVTDFAQVETTIAQELGLSTQDVRRLVRYEVLD